MEEVFQVSCLPSEEGEQRQVWSTPRQTDLWFTFLWHMKMVWKTLRDLATLELLPPSLILTQPAKRSYWLPAAITPETSCHSYCVSKVYVVYTHKERKLSRNARSFHSYSYTWECPSSTLLLVLFWGTKNIRYKKVLYREPNLLDTWQKRNIRFHIAEENRSSYSSSFQSFGINF